MTKIPYWANRRLNLIVNQLSKTEVQETLVNVRIAIMSIDSKGTEYDLTEDGSLDAFNQLIYLIGFPRGAAYLLLELIRKKTLTRDEAAKLLQPPFRSISFVHKHIGPTRYGHAYEEAVNRIKYLLSDEYAKSSPLFANEGEVYLRIDADTTKEELISFIEAEYQKEIKPYLTPARVSLVNDKLMNKTSRVKKVKDFMDPIDKMILDKSGAGMTAYKIADQLGINHSPQVVSKKLDRINRINNQQFRIT